MRTIETALLITGNARGGIRAVKATSREIEALNAAQSRGRTANRQYRRSFRQTETTLDRFSQQVRRSIGVLSAGALTSGLARTTDLVQNLDARYRLVTDSTEEFARAQQEVGRISIDTFTSLEATATLYFRLEQSVRDLGLAQTEVLGITESINQAVQVSGATATEATNALIQLSQGFASGQLRGEEFRSVAEQTPRILQVLQDSLGKTRGELRQLAEDGELTTEVITKAFADQADVLANEAADLPVTIGRGFQNLGSAITLYIQQNDAAITANQAFAESLVFISENLDEVITIAGGLAAALAVRGVTSSEAYRSSLQRLQAQAAATRLEVQLLGRGLGTVSAIAGAGQAAVAGFGRVVQFLGGPLGFGLFAASALLAADNAGLFGDSVDEAARISERAAESINKASESISNFGRSEGSEFRIEFQLNQIERQITAAQERIAQRQRELLASSFSGLTFNAQDSELVALNQSVQDFQDQAEALRAVLLGLDEGIEAVFGETLVTAGQAVVGFVQSLDQLRVAREEQTQTVNELIEDLQSEIETHEQNEKSILDQARAALGLTEASEDLRDELSGLVSELEDLNRQQQIAEDAQKSFDEALSLSTSIIDQYGSSQARISVLEKQRSEDVTNLTANTVELTKAGVDVSAAIQAVNDRYQDSVRDINLASVETERYADLISELANSGMSQLQAEIVSVQVRIREATALFGEQSNEVRELIALLAALSAQQAGLSLDSDVQAGVFGGTGAGQLNNIADVFEEAIKRGSEDGAGAFKDTISEAFKENPIEFVSQGAAFLDNSLQLFRNAETSLGGIAAVASQFGGTVGLIANIAQSIDSITGGRLFGTSFETDSTGVNLAFGAGGFSGNQFIEESRQRSFFRGTRRRTREEALDADTQNSLDEFFEAVGVAVADAARRLAVSVPQAIAGEFEQEFDKDGNLVSSTSRVLGRVYQESLEQFQERILAENILATAAQSANTVDVTTDLTTRNVLGNEFGNFGGVDIVLGQITEQVNEIQFVAERWRDNSEDLLEGAQFLVLAQESIINGNALLGDSLIETTDFVEELANAGETLSDTFVRLLAGAETLEAAFDLVGNAFEGTRQEFVRFSADFAESAGGVDRAAQLWDSFFENFVDSTELLQRRIQLATDSASSELGDVGLTTAISEDAFADLFNQRLPDLSAEALVQWLEAADALATLNNLQEDYNTIIQEQAQTQAENLAELNEILRDTSGASQFQLAILELRSEFDELVQSAIEAGASQEQLARIEQDFARQSIRLVEQLRGATESLVAELFGTPLSAIEEQIALLEESANSTTSAITRVRDSSSSLFREWESAIDRLRDFTQSLLLDNNLSPLTPLEQLQEAQSQFDTLLAAANSGDVNAAQALPDAARQLLELLRFVEGSGGDFDSRFNEITAQLNAVNAPAISSEPQPVTIVGGAINIATEELSALYAERDRIAAEQEAATRLALAQQLTQNLGDLSAALGESVLELIDGFGIPLDQLVLTLGGSLTDLTVETVGQLANISNSLDTDLSDLARELGLTIGELSDQNSLINDALEAAINELPEGFVQGLLDPLRALETATTQADANVALAALNDVTNQLPAEYANALAPFLAGVDVSASEAEITNQFLDVISTIQTELRDQNADIVTNGMVVAQLLDTLNQSTLLVEQAIRELPTADATPQLNTGGLITRDGLATVHKGEIVLNRARSDAFQRLTLPAPTQGRSDERLMQQLLMEIRRLTDVAEEGNEIDREGYGYIAENQDRTNATIENNSRPDRNNRSLTA